MASPPTPAALLFLLLLLPFAAAAFTDVPFAGSLPVPTKQQLEYQGSISALIHFGMATFFHDGDPGCTAENWNGCDPKGGCNSSQVSSFAPSNLNISSWVESFKALGATSAVLTAKHGCGFLGWQTKTTLPDGSPYGYVKEERGEESVVLFCCAFCALCACVLCVRVCACVLVCSVRCCILIQV